MKRSLHVLLFLALSSLVVAEWDLEWVLEQHEKLDLFPKDLETALKNAQQSVVPHDRWLVRVTEGSDIDEVAKSIGLRVKKFDYGYWLLEPTEETKLNKRAELAGHVHASLSTHPEVAHFERENLKFYKPRAINDITDKYFKSQWHLNQPGDFQLNVAPVWNQGLHGEGVTVCVVDDGVEWDNPDLLPNYNADGSFDFQDEDSDPDPGISTSQTPDNHGTPCAGIIAGAADGQNCGVGVAYKAQFSAIRAISSTAPQQESGIRDSLSYKRDLNQIYSCSWGIPPCQNGPICDLIPIASPTREMFANNTRYGRNGRGNIYVFAGGNSRALGSDTNYQDTGRQIETIMVGAYGQDGQFSSYSDPGAGLLISAPSTSGNASLPGIISSDRNRLPGLGYVANSGCTERFGGTSAAAPMVSGVIALMLQKDPNLTWRDVQDILVRSAQPRVDAFPKYRGWQKNAGGLYFSHDYGFGRIDAERAVLETTYKSGKYLTCSKSAATENWQVNLPILDLRNATSEKMVSGITAVEILEQVLIVVNITHPARGQMTIILKSPSGVQSVLARKRNDLASDYYGWVFRSVAHWDENPNGVWQLEVRDQTAGLEGTLNNWQLIFYGKCPGESTVQLSNGQLVGIIVGTVGGVILIGTVLAIALFVRRRR